MFRKTEDFIYTAKMEFGSTLKVFDSLKNEMLHKEVNGYSRTPAFLAWHIIKTVTDMLKMAGLNHTYQPADEMPAGLTVADLKYEFKKVSDSALQEVEAYWKDENLTDETPMYGGEMWRKGMTLMIVLTHQIHHRGQLEVLMRINLCTVPGIYGPSREEWGTFGMPELP
ncbi:DinB family protein [soil metagenome]